MFTSLLLTLLAVSCYARKRGYVRAIVELKQSGIETVHKTFFDTIKAKPRNMTDFRVNCEEKRINVRYFSDGHVGISLDETTLADDVRDILHLFGVKAPSSVVNDNAHRYRWRSYTV